MKFLLIMGSSNDKINYNLRPSKSIERKMILAVLKELCPPSLSSQYQYVGMGSAFFVDFKLMHQVIGIKDMYSFEGKKSNIGRCQFNKPFDCIEVIPERTEKALGEMNWDKRSIIWLDYEDELKQWMLQDLDTICINAQSGNVLLITLNREFQKITSTEFNETFGENIEGEVVTDDLHKLNSAKVLREVFRARISSKLKNIFSTEEESKKIKFHPIFDFTYEDGAPMYTFGGIFLKEEDKASFSSYQFHDFDFVQESNQPYNITCPIITDKEYHLLNSFLPATSVDDFNGIPEIDFIPVKHRENYYRTYKFYPNFFEVRG